MSPVTLCIASLCPMCIYKKKNSQKMLFEQIICMISMRNKIAKVGIKGSWFVNNESISWLHQRKIGRSSISQEFFFLYDNFKIISIGNICQSICLDLNDWDWSKKEKNYVECFGLF